MSQAFINNLQKFGGVEFESYFQVLLVLTYNLKEMPIPAPE
jgi:hypothetical protein